MILYTENTEDSIGKLLELISEFSKVAGYKSNTQKSVASLILTMKNQKIKESTPFTTATKEIKYLGINVPKETNCTQKIVRH